MRLHRRPEYVMDQQTDTNPLSVRMLDAATKVGKAMTAYGSWAEQLHDWTAPETYRELKVLVNAIDDAAVPAYWVALGRCLACHHPEHIDECGHETGNYVYDTRCTCRYNADLALE